MFASKYCAGKLDDRITFLKKNQYNPKRTYSILSRSTTICLLKFRADSQYKNSLPFFRLFQTQSKQQTMADNNEFTQKGPEGRVSENVPEDLNSGLKLFTNRLCPFAHR